MPREITEPQAVSLASEKPIGDGKFEENSFLKLSFGKLYCQKLSSARQSGKNFKSMQTSHPNVREFIALYRAGVIEMIFPVILARSLGATDGKDLKILSTELKKEIIRPFGKQMKHSCVITNEPS